MMIASDEAHARCLAYGLLADLIERGLGESTREAATLSRAIATAIEGQDEETVAVDHEHAFGWAVPPFEGIFLDVEGVIGGEATEQLGALYRASGYAPRGDTEHVSTILGCLAFLSGAEADALEDENRGAVRRTRALCRRVLDEHLLRWVPLFVQAVRRLGRPFPTALVEEVGGLLTHHRGSLSSEPARWTLAASPPLDANPEAGLREIAALLATPARAGLFLGREDIRRIGRRLQIPRGFGERRQELLNLLRSAARFDAFDPLLRELMRETDEQRESLKRAPFTSTGAELAPWHERACATIDLLVRLRSKAATLSALEMANTAPETTSRR